jgi:hypothetical protein
LEYGTNAKIVFGEKVAIELSFEGFMGGIGEDYGNQFSKLASASRR